ncbi:ATPase AAA [Labrys miyagiensis]|uniref:ATPase AAA n=1 Tax=Labrys miyagiensis TaxID=346912 RepID=A0ABQ6CF33_9HYPH|nr:MoxR family ATPase [Labrys miyagiensis]GLS17279.1 ATPase AAA [Labrys miyagiensis]
MNNFYPKSPSEQHPPQPLELPPLSTSAFQRPDKYLADPGLVDAVNVALLLRQPLVVTGEPGTGKTVLAWSVAWELGLEPPLVFETKSTSQAKDLFYYYDTLGRFTAKELRTDAGTPNEYITYSALGAAIVLTNSLDTVVDIVPSGFCHPGKRRSVVLIDEVEKAPREFANDILNELERMYFRIPELGNRRVEADENYSPIVLMTNNSEKSLPDAFLRRCIYYDIPFPVGSRLEEIVASRLPELMGTNEEATLIRDAIQFLLHARSESAGLEKPPGTAELLSWLNAMTKLGAEPRLSLLEQITFAERAFPALAKISGDQMRVRELLRGWNGGRSKI